jgi:hypothetical protein
MRAGEHRGPRQSLRGGVYGMCSKPISEAEERVDRSNLSRSSSFPDGKYVAQMFVEVLEIGGTEATHDCETFDIRHNLLRQGVQKVLTPRPISLDSRPFPQLMR